MEGFVCTIPCRLQASFPLVVAARFPPGSAQTQGCPAPLPTAQVPEEASFFDHISVLHVKLSTTLCCDRFQLLSVAKERIVLFRNGFGEWEILRCRPPESFWLPWKDLLWKAGRSGEQVDSSSSHHSRWSIWTHWNRKRLVEGRREIHQVSSRTASGGDWLEQLIKAWCTSCHPLAKKKHQFSSVARRWLAS